MQKLLTSKRMVFLPTILLITMLISYPGTIASAAYLVSVPYSKFNTTTATWYYVDKTYDGTRDSFVIKITNKLTLNTSQGEPAKIRFAPDNAGQGAFLEVQIYPDGMLKIYHPDAGTEFYAQPNVWGPDTTLKIYLEPGSNNLQKIIIYKGNEKIATLNTGDIVTVKMFAAMGNTGVATSGTVEVAIEDMVTFKPVINLMYAIVPIVVLVAVVGYVARTIKSMGK